MFGVSGIALALALACPASSQAPEPATYRVVPEESHLEVEVGRAGLFKMFGHDHRIVASGVTGEAAWSASTPASSSFTIEIDAASLRVADEEVSEEDRGKIQSDMETKALVLADHPKIRFESESVVVRDRDDEAGVFRLELDGTLSLRGVERPLRVPLELTLRGETLTARGDLELQSDAWGVPQISAVAGAVKTKKELEIRFTIVSRR